MHSHSIYLSTLNTDVYRSYLNVARIASKVRVSLLHH